MKLDNAHWRNEHHEQRMTREQWREILLEEQDKIIVKGCLRTFKARHLGAGVYAVSKEPK